MTPTFYYYDASTPPPNGSQEDKGTFPLIASLVHALTEARELFSLLTLLEERSKVARGDNDAEYDHVRAQFENANVRLLYQTKSRADRLGALLQDIHPDKISDVLAVLDTDRRSLWRLVEAEDLLSGLLQSTDSYSLKARLLYFSQHEWRLIKVLRGSIFGYDLAGPAPRESRKFEKIRAETLRTVHRVAQFQGTTVKEEWRRECWVLLYSPYTKKFFRDYIKVITDLLISDGCDWSGVIAKLFAKSMRPARKAG
jgi:hypothetical protein